MTMQVFIQIKQNNLTYVSVNPKDAENGAEKLQKETFEKIKSKNQYETL